MNAKIPKEKGEASDTTTNKKSVMVMVYRVQGSLIQGKKYRNLDFDHRRVYSSRLRTIMLLAQSFGKRRGPLQVSSGNKTLYALFVFLDGDGPSTFERANDMNELTGLNGKLVLRNGIEFVQDLVDPLGYVGVVALIAVKLVIFSTFNVEFVRFFGIVLFIVLRFVVVSSRLRFEQLFAVMTGIMARVGKVAHFDIGMS